MKKATLKKLCYCSEWFEVSLVSVLVRHLSFSQILVLCQCHIYYNSLWTSKLLAPSADVIKMDPLPVFCFNQCSFTLTIQSSEKLILLASALWRTSLTDCHLGACLIELWFCFVLIVQWSVCTVAGRDHYLPRTSLAGVGTFRVVTHLADVVW